MRFETAVHDHGRRLNQREFRPMAEVAFRPARQLSEYKGKGASASREGNRTMISFLGTVVTGLLGLFLFLFRTSLTL